VTGTILSSHTFTDVGDSSAGHQQEWSLTTAVTPATSLLVVTIQATTNAPVIFSDTRTFTVTYTV
jgi:hypothetical protein